MALYSPPAGGGGLTSPVGIADGGTGATTAEGARSAILPSTQADPGTTWDPAAIGITYAAGRNLWIRASAGGFNSRLAGRIQAVSGSPTIIAAWNPTATSTINYGFGGVMIRDGTYAYVIGPVTQSGSTSIAYARFDVSTGSNRTGLGAVTTQVCMAWYGFRDTGGGSWAPCWSPDGETWYGVAATTGMPVSMTPTHYGIGVAADGVGVAISTRQIIAATDATDFVSQIRPDVGL